MSWMKRQGGAAPPRPDPQAYAVSQAYVDPQSMFPNYQGTAAGQQQQIWPMPQQQQQQYNQQYSQVYQQQPFVNSTNQYFQQSQQYNQNYANQNFDNVQQGYQQNYNHNQAPQQQKFMQNEGNVDSWEDNWGWGWEDSSKQFQKSINQPPSAQPTMLATSQPQLYNNANVIEESFASTNSWNWSMEEKKDTQVPPPPIQSFQDNKEEAPHLDNMNNENNVINEPTSQRSISNISAQDGPEEIKNLSDKEIVKEQLPNLALGKRFNLENLTPQWSIESQMSQDSSDGPHTQSEGTYRSENQSRNSNKSSPGPNTDTTNFNYSQSGLNEMSLTNSEWSKHSSENSNPISNLQNNNRHESFDELVNSVQEMNLGLNHENTLLDVQQSNHKIENLRDSMQSPGQSTPLNPTVVHPPSNHTQNMPPPPPISSQQVLSSTISNTSKSNSAHSSQPLPPINMQTPSHVTPNPLPPPPSTVPLLPPSLPSSSNQNPFKSGAPFSHKNIAKIPNNSQSQIFTPQIPTSNLTSPTVVNKVVQQDRLSASFGANLETTPDNSEQPDQPQMTNYRSMPIPPQVPDNMEIAPQNDRNEYLQTAHLSSGDYDENTDFSGNVPPPGLRRMGVGQQEVEYNQSLNISGDEPPPGLSRMVPGQQTEADISYNKVGDNYLDRQIDGQPTDSSGRPYRQADGQPNADNYTQSVSNRSGDRRPVGLDRMVPGEPSNDEYQQYQGPSYTPATEHRVVTGVDHDYSIATDAGPSDIREQNMDGSDYTEPPRNPSRNVIGAREASNATSPDFSLSIDDQQREITMEGENLQDLSTITYDGSNANIVEGSKDRNLDAVDPNEYPSNNSRRQSVNRVTSGEDSERDRAFKASPRKDRDKQKSSRDRERDRDRDRDKDRGRYSRGDRKYDRESERRSGRDERRSEKDRRDWDHERRDREGERKDREGSPDVRRHRRSTRSHRYETEDTDCYSDRERDRRQYREGSYTSSKPPRGDDKDRRYDDRERRRYNTIERERRREAYEEERSRRSDRHRDRERFERRCRDIDTRKFGSLRREKDDDDKRKGETYSSGSRAGSREATATDEDVEEPRRRAHRDERRRHRHHHYYEGYGGAVAPGAQAGTWDEALEAQRRQYEYYERLRRTDPAAYMRIYKQLLNPSIYGNQLYDGYGPMGYERGPEERGSVHSGRSSANGLKPTDTYYARARDAASLRTDGSDRELTTDMSLNLHLEESTVRSERMTPFKYSTAHVKGVLGGRALLVVSAGYPVDGRAPALQLLPLTRLLQRDPVVSELIAYPGPLIKGVTHKKSVVEYCTWRVRSATGPDAVGYALLWELLALLLRQNGVVVGSDIGELLMKNTIEFEYKIPSAKSTECGTGSTASGEGELEPEVLPAPIIETIQQEDDIKKPPVDEKEALERFREYLIYGNRQEALEWAMQCGLWGHALQLAAHGERRARAAVCARFVASLTPSDPLHSLYATLSHRSPPAATCVSDERWGDWRPHAAIILSNTSSKPEQDRRTLTQLGDTLSARGLLYSAQFCYLSAGVPFAPHPLAPHRVAPTTPTAPPRLALLLADSRASTLGRFATEQAIFATEIYEYALSLSQDYVLDELPVYKLLLGTRLADAGLCERALGYVEQAARAVTRNPRHYSASLVAAIATLADKLKYYDPALQDEGADDIAEDVHSGGGSPETSPRHQQWLRDVQAVAVQLSAEASQQNTPQHHAENFANNSQYTAWGDQTLQQNHSAQQYADPTEDTTDYSQYYHQQQQQQQQQLQQQQQHQPLQQQVPEPVQEQQYEQQYGYEEHAQSYADPYWQNDTHYGYHENTISGGGAEEAPQPMITMPGSAPSKPVMFGDMEDERPASADHTDRETDTPKTNGKKNESKTIEGSKDKKSGWLGGILTKLSLRAPNQMILPDDTNPTIVWDEEHKRWRDTGASETDAPAPPPPPPTGIPAAMTTSTPLQSPGAVAGVGPPVAPMSNIFKMQKGRHIKKSYVDVLNPGGARLAAAPMAAPPAPLVPTAAPDNYFIPAPLPDQHIPKPVQVSIPSSPEASPRPDPAPLLPEGGIYDPSQLATAEEDYRSGI